MKFKSGDILVHTLAKMTFTVVGVNYVDKIYEIIIEGTTMPRIWKYDYVEKYFEKQTKLNKLLSEVSDEV
jgi:hypothetical protein